VSGAFGKEGGGLDAGTFAESGAGFDGHVLGWNVGVGGFEEQVWGQASAGIAA
jgi:hypothetical protein